MPILRLALRSFALVLASLAFSGLPACAANPDALWQIVHNYCEPAALGADVQQKCVAVDPAAGFAVLKDINGDTQYLLIPTARIGGIEGCRGRRC